MLIGRTIGLRTVQPSDYQRLYEIATAGHQTTWRNLARTVPPDLFPGFLWEGVHSQRAIFPLAAPNECVGLVSIFNEDATNQVAYLSLLVDPTVTLTTAGGEAVALWLRHVFSCTAFRKIYAETTELSIAQVGVTPAALPGAVEEGRLRDHVLRGGRAHDLVVLAIYRDAFLDEAASVLTFLDREPQMAHAQSVDHPAWPSFLAELAGSCDLLADRKLTEEPGGTRLDEDLGLDSLAVVQIVAWLEERYDVSVDDAALVELRSLQDLFALTQPPSA